MAETVAVVLADPMEGVRDAWRWLLAADPRVTPGAEAATVAEALGAPGAVVLAGLRFADGTAQDLVRAESRPVVVWTFLPPDERAGLDLSGAQAVLGPGELRSGLTRALVAASGVSGSSGP